MSTDFSKLFAANGIRMPINDNDFLKGFEYLGSNPPTREEFNWLFYQIGVKLLALYNGYGINSWQPEKEIQLGTVLSIENGGIGGLHLRYLAKCTTAGITGNKEPIWAAKAGEIVIDGTVVWTIIDLDYIAPMTGATSSAAGKSGLVPAPEAGSQATKYLRADGTWQVPDERLILQRNKAYAVGDIAYHKDLPSWARLECVQAGTTGDTIDFTQISSGGGI